MDTVIQVRTLFSSIRRFLACLLGIAVANQVSVNRKRRCDPHAVRVSTAARPGAATAVPALGCLFIWRCGIISPCFEGFKAGARYNVPFGRARAGHTCILKAASSLQSRSCNTRAVPINIAVASTSWPLPIPWPAADLTDESEFWLGRLQGQPPPRPKVFLHDAPPLVIVPGFGAGSADYTGLHPHAVWPMPRPTALGPSKEVGMVQTLARRSDGNVTVVPVARSDWLKVIRGLTDVQFYTCNMQPESPAYMWYLDVVRKTVEDEAAAAGGQRVVLIGHSAGGWLARALCLTAGNAWSQQHVRGIVTLGTPNVLPPKDGIDQTRGVIDNLNRRAPGAYLAGQGIFYVTVSSQRVVGDEEGDAAAKKAFNSYRLILGKGQGVVGDGLVPMDLAFIDGATKLVLPCYHSGGQDPTDEPWPKDDWYGAEKNVDLWLKTVADSLAAC